MKKIISKCCLVMTAVLVCGSVCAMDDAAVTFDGKTVTGGTQVIPEGAITVHDAQAKADDKSATAAVAARYEGQVEGENLD